VVDGSGYEGSGAPRLPMAEQFGGRGLASRALDDLTRWRRSSIRLSFTARVMVSPVSLAVGEAWVVVGFGTYLCSGSNIGASLVRICLPAGWVLIRQFELTAAHGQHSRFRPGRTPPDRVGLCIACYVDF